MTSRGVVTVLVAASLIATAAGPAFGADGQNGSWWYTTMHVEEAIASGATGEGITIAVIDGQINTQVPHLKDADIRVREPSHCLEPGTSTPDQADTTDVSFDSLHGTNVVSMIVGTGQPTNGHPGVQGIAPNATVLFHAVGDGTDQKDGMSCSPVPNTYGITTGDLAIIEAVDSGAKIISMSFIGASGPSGRALMAWAMREGVIIVAGLPNETGGMTGMTVNGAVAAGSFDPDLNPVNDADGYSPTVRAPGSEILAFSPSFDVFDEHRDGNSYAAPLVAGILAAVWSKYPDATSNQILQSMVHNTGAQDHEVGWDPVYGYGLISLRHMLAHDPAEYEDVNPLITENGNGTGTDLTAADIANATRPDWAPPPPAPDASPSPQVTGSPHTDTATGDPATESDSLIAGLALWVWILIGVLISIAVIVPIVAIRAHSKIESRS